jgi:hypothetical protein
MGDRDRIATTGVSNLTDTREALIYGSLARCLIVKSASGRLED